jgi:hypothetical protein
VHPVYADDCDPLTDDCSQQGGGNEGNDSLTGAHITKKLKRAREQSKKKRGKHHSSTESTGDGHSGSK